MRLEKWVQRKDLLKWQNWGPHSQRRNSQIGLVWSGLVHTVSDSSDSFLQLSTSPLVVGAGAGDLSPQWPQ